MKFLFFVAVTFLLLSPVFAKIDSVYTSLFMEDCVVVDSSDDYPDAEIDFMESECASYGGYKVMVNGSDLRYAVRLSYKGKDIPTTNIGAFHDLASDKAEWRYEISGKDYAKKIKYYALIYRLSYMDFQPKTNKPFQNEMMVVVRLNENKSCLLGNVPKGARMNEEARKLADNKNARCL